MRRITRNNTRHAEARRVPVPPALTVALGETFVMEAGTCGRPVLNTPDECLADGFMAREETGPVYIEGVRAGDMVRLDILDIKVVGHASGMVYADRYDFCEVRGDAAICRGGLPAPVEPMIGVICFTPEKPEDVADDLGDCGGNMDYKDIAPPNSVCLTARHDGGLLYVGDLHACQGWGEWLGVGLECAGDVTLRATLEKTYVSPRPVVLKKDAYACIAMRETYAEAVRVALADAAAILSRLTGASHDDAYNYCRLVGNGMNGQMWHIPFPDLYSKENPVTGMPVTVGMEIPTGMLKKHGLINI